MMTKEIGFLSSKEHRAESFIPGIDIVVTLVDNSGKSMDILPGIDIVVTLVYNSEFGTSNLVSVHGYDMRSGGVRWCEYHLNKSMLNYSLFKSK